MGQKRAAVPAGRLRRLVSSSHKVNHCMYEGEVTTGQCCQIGRVPRRVPAQLGSFEFDCADKYWLGRVDKIWAGLGSVCRFSNIKII